MTDGDGVGENGGRVELPAGEIGDEWFEIGAKIQLKRKERLDYHEKYLVSNGFKIGLAVGIQCNFIQQNNFNVQLTHTPRNFG